MIPIVKSHTLSNGFDSYVELTTITIDLKRHKKAVSFGDIRNAVIKMREFKSEEVYLSRPCSAYDCTGEHFTTSLDCLNTDLYAEEDTVLLIGIYKHYVSIDV